MGLLTTPERSRMMSGIRGKNTRPELDLRRELFAAGLRYRLHRRDLPGSPDLVFPKFRAVVFVHGCFWHRHEGCVYTTNPKANSDFWQRKFAGNVLRDARDVTLLKESGWRVAIVWECAVKRSVSAAGRAVVEWLPGSSPDLNVT